MWFSDYKKDLNMDTFESSVEYSERVLLLTKKLENIRFMAKTTPKIYAYVFGSVGLVTLICGILFGIIIDFTLGVILSVLGVFMMSANILIYVRSIKRNNIRYGADIKRLTAKLTIALKKM